MKEISIGAGGCPHGKEADGHHWRRDRHTLRYIDKLEYISISFVFFFKFLIDANDVSSDVKSDASDPPSRSRDEKKYRPKFFLKTRVDASPFAKVSEQ